MSLTPNIKRMNFKAAIFDFNGTLLWDTDYHNKAFDIFLDKYNIQLTDEEKRIKIHGKTNPDIMRGIFSRPLSDEEIATISLEKELIYQDLIRHDLHLAPGAESLFNWLSNNNIPFTIATSAGIENVDFYFEKMPLSQWFSVDKVVYNDGSFRGKPAPDIFLAAIKKLGIPANETVIFEDSVAGIEAAENAGAGKIYIINSTNDDYSRFPHEVITHFDSVDRKLFEK